MNTDTDGFHASEPSKAATGIRTDACPAPSNGVAAEFGFSSGFAVATLCPGLLRPTLALATGRAGGFPILDFEYARDPSRIGDAIERLNREIQRPFGIKLGGGARESVAQVITKVPNHVTTVILVSDSPEEIQQTVQLLHESNTAVFLEATCLEQARMGEALGVEVVVAKGHEAGGRIGEETTFVLLQHFRAEVRLPVWAYGGVGLHTAAACIAAGAAGCVLDAQLALTRESALDAGTKARIAGMDGSETVCLGGQLGETYRVYGRPGNPAIKELEDLELHLAADNRARGDVVAEWRQAIRERIGWDAERNLLPLGQDAAFAATLAKRHRTVGGVLRALREAVEWHGGAAEKLRPLAEGSALAESHGTRYPILQGPMARVSDVPEFAGRVAEEGALPFLALAVMRGTEVRALLSQVQARLGGRPWGVGLIGFVPPELLQEQLAALAEFRPPFALMAGGRPEQSRVLEQQGIPTYLHVPSPGLLRIFIQQGARRFIFEGRECGGHVGPRTSFVLWNQIVEVLLDSAEVESSARDFHVVFAGGIHDGLSAAMVSAIAAPLAERGVRVGVLLGTAYLFTEEAVDSGAIVTTYQEQARGCRRTVVLETGPGHASRCLDTPYAAAFAREKRRLSLSGTPPERVRAVLEDLNIGRLWVASKGVARGAAAGVAAAAGREEQVADGMYMIGQVAALRDQVCTIRALHHAIAADSSQALLGLAGRCRQVSAIGRGETCSNVAVIGMACLLPKAPDLPTYWDNILHKVDAIGEIPQERWDWRLYFDADRKAKDKIYSRWGGFLDDVPFDPVRYGMPPASLRSIEPAQLLTLEVARAALEDAGYLDRPFARERASVILGAGGGAADLGLGYGARSFLPNLESLPEFRGRSQEIVERMSDRLPEWTEDSFAGILANVLAGRVANRFDFGGSNYTVDAACASSLAAVAAALKELETHSSDLVIAGGVDTMQNPFTYLCFSKTLALSPRGRCCPFDESADGIAISEGIVMLVFKRLEDAERDGDRIYAVIKGAGSSSDGKDRGLMAPRPEGQARALTRAYAKAGITPASVGLIEAHGTGTVAGDTAEVQALTQVFSEAQARRQSCAIGSVKSMIGHTKCAAGAAGLAKAVLALHHKVLPPTLGVTKPSPTTRFPETPFFVNTEPRPWLQNATGHPRRAGVSAFGFGGTNFHVVLEEYRGDGCDAQVAPCRDWPEELFVWSGQTCEALLAAVEPWDKALAGNAVPPLRDLAYTAWKQAESQAAAHNGPPLRLALVANSRDDLRQKLSTALKSLAQPDTTRIHDPRGIYYSQQPLAGEGKLAFLFPGQGSQYPRMLEDLLLYFPEMRQVFEQATQALEGKLREPLSSYVFPGPTFSKAEERERQQELTRTNVAQPALGAAGLAMFGLLREFGLEPAMAAGHSYGEYVALAAAGVFSAESLILLSEARGRCIVEGAGAEPGVMAAIEADAATVTEAIRSCEGVCLANANAPRQCVISGNRASVERAVERFSAQGIPARLIQVACAFHSPTVMPAQARLAEFLSQVAVAEPRIPVYSNTTAAPYSQAPAEVRRQLVEHLVRPVEFVREIETMYDAGARLFVEVGPRGILTSFVEQILGDRPKAALASNQNGRPGLAQLLHLLAQLAAQGCELNLNRLYRDRSDRQVELDALESAYGTRPLAPSVWMVNGSRARPLKTPRKNPVPAPRAAEPAVAAGARAPRPNGAAAAVAGLGPPISPGAPAAPVAWGSLPQVMAQFQQTMAAFLETQKSVMLAYLDTGSADTSTAHGLGAPAGLTAQGPGDAPPPGQATPRKASNRPAADAAPPAAAPQPAREQLTARLLAIVSERTGYPPEMLQMNLDLEADLGIDSIKRVEILGTLQQFFAADGAGASGSLTEKLSGVRTLGEIVDRIMATVEAAPPSASRDATSAAGEKPPEPAGLPAARLSKEQLQSQLLAIVSERTGYPAEMLALDLDLEGDLSIDSIKRVEILGTLQQLFAANGVAPGEGLTERLSGVRTLQGIIDRVLEHLDAAVAVQDHPHAERPAREEVAHEAPAASPQEPAAQEHRIGRFTLTTVDAPPGVRSRSLAKDRVVLIAHGAHAVGGALAGELAGSGYKVATVCHGSGVAELAAGRYTADLGSPDSAAALIQLVTQRQGRLGGLVHLLALEMEPAPGARDFQSWKEELRVSIKSLFYLAKAAGADLRAAGPGSRASLLAATAMGGTFLSDLPAGEAGRFPSHGAIGGLLKTVAAEWPEVHVAAVDVNLEEHGPALARQLCVELQAEDGRVEIGYSAGRRVTLEPTSAPLAASAETAVPLDPSSVILVTGGARGITAQAARRLAELYRPTLVLVGRTPLPPAEEAVETAGITAPKELKLALMAQMRAREETVTPAAVERWYARLGAERAIRATLAALRQLGARPHYFGVDVRDAEAFGALIDDIYSSFGRLDGVIHGAGVIEDKLLEDKAPDSFDRVFDTKVDSAFVLSRKLRPESLKFLVFFASVAGRFGNRGQADYAAANEVLNKLAVCLDRAWPARVVAINWGPWDAEGMVSAEVRKQFAERGVALIPAAIGVRRLEEEIRFGHRGEAEVIVGGAEWRPAPQRPTPQRSRPLLGDAILSRSNGNLELIRELNPAHDLYLNHHRLDGQPVLPFAISTELMAEAVANAWPEMQVTSVRDAQLLNGIVIENGAKAVRVLAKSQSGMAPAPASVAVEITGTGPACRPHYRAIVELAPRLPEAPAVTLPPLADGQPFALDVPELYRRWLFHGPLFHGISRIDEVGTGGIKALLATSSPDRWVAGGATGHWLIDPLMFDSALQLIVLWARQHWGMTALPSGFQRFRRFAAAPASDVRCEMRLRPNTGRPAIHADIFFMEAGSGRVLGIVEDMQGACSEALNRLAGQKPAALAAGNGS